MFKELHIKNIGPHGDLKLNFHSGINGIIGISQSGKTAILRAIYLLAFNKPGGLGFLSRFAKNKTASVSLIQDNGTEIKFSKTKVVEQRTTAFYVLKEPGKSKIVFSKLGGAVPDKITTALNISDINIQRQRDTAFMIDSNPGEIAKTINKITNIDQVDSWMKKISVKINILKTREVVAKEDLKEIKSKLKQLAYLDPLSYKIDRLRIIEDKKYKLSAKIDFLQVQIESVKATQKARSTIVEVLLKLESLFKRLKKLQEQRAQLQTERTELDKLFMANATWEELLKEQNKDLDIYISNLKEQSKCPTCLKPITSKDVKRIAREIRFA